MKRILMAFLLISSVFCNAQEKPVDLFYQDFAIKNDSLLLTGGVDPLEFQLGNAPNDLLQEYKRHVFTVDENKNYTKARHWSVPIKIFIDKSIAKDIREEFAQFIIFLPKIERLSVSLVSSLKDANYFVTTSDKTIDPFDQDFYKGITYSLINDFSGKFYCARLFCNPVQMKDNKVTLIRLKQFFFASLGNFCIRMHLNGDSLLGEDYINARTISRYDYAMLRYHYSLYNKNAVGYEELKQLQQQLNTSTFTNSNGRFTLKLKP